MNCKNCECPSCVNDRNRTELKSHRLLTIKQWWWHCNPSEAADMILAELAAGRGGSRREWAMDIEAELPPRDSQAVLKLIGERDCYHENKSMVASKNNKQMKIMNKIQAIELGREWLEDSSECPWPRSGPDFMRGEFLCVCNSCFHRIAIRDLDFKKIVNIPIWSSTGKEVCDLCRLNSKY